MPIPSEHRVRKNSAFHRLTALAATLGLLCAVSAVSAASAAVAAPAAAHKRTQTTTANAAAAGANDSVYDLLEQEKQTDNIFKAFFPSLEVARKAAISFHGQLLESNYKDGYLILELDAADMDRLRPFGFRFERASEFIERRNRALTQAQLRLSRAAGEPAPNAISGYACYETVEETFAVADALLAAKPTLGSWVDAGNSWLKTQGAGGYDMRVLKLSNSAVPAPAGGKPILFVNSAIHAREYTTAPLSLEFARWLVNGHGSNADATWILDHHEVHLMLHTNPDGRKRAETGLSWRKNVNNNFCANTNTRGIDLNRNFSATWNSTGGVGSSGSACSLTFRGPSAGSEPETLAIESYIRSLWPDRRGPGLSDAAPADTSGVHLDIHSYSQLVLWPWGETATQAPNGPALQTMGRRLAYFNGYTPQQSIGLYPTDGTSDSPSYYELGVASFTIELGTAFFESCAEYEATTKPTNLPALIYAAKVVRTPYITPGGPDVSALSLGSNAATTGVVAGAWVALTGSASDARFNNSNGVEATQNLTAAEYTIDTPPWQADAVPRPLLATDGAFDAVTEGLSGQINTTGLSLGKHIVYVRARDASGVWGPVTASFLNISAVPSLVADAEANDSFAQPQLVATLPALVNGTMAASQRVSRSGDIDIYRMLVPAGKTLTATLTPNAASDYNLKVHAANFAVVASSQLGTGQVDRVSVTNTSATDAVMYVRVDFFTGLADTAAATYALLMQIEP
jgi:carboxypeptidase T